MTLSTPSTLAGVTVRIVQCQLHIAVSKAMLRRSWPPPHFFSVLSSTRPARKAVREEFVRYGFPSWWCWITAILEFLTAVLLILRPTFAIGVALGACIMVAAILAVVRARDFRHIPPPSVFLLLLIIAALVQFSS
jgi:uncharacterized membrane protein YphA (DoxX/SURF4 family)